MKYILILTIFLAFSVIGKANAQDIIEGNQAYFDFSPMAPLEDISKPTIAIFRSDDCRPCKILEPRLDAAIALTDDVEDLKVITFDLTNDQTRAEAATIAGRNNLADIYNAVIPEEGIAIMVDRDLSPESQPRLTHDNSIAELKASIKQYINDYQ
jgi:hypothetical protein